MHASVDRLVTVVREVVRAVRAENVTFLAASVAYYAFISLIPTLLLLFAIATAIAGAAVADQLLLVTGEFLTPAGQEAVATALASAAGRGGATILGLVVLVWSALKVFRALDTAFMMVYGSTPDRSFVGTLVDAASVAVGIGLGITAMFVIGGVIATLDLGPAVELLGLLALPVVLTVVFLPMYYLFPQPPVSVREVLPGSAFAAVGWTVLQAGFQVYAVNAGRYQVYGVIGGVLLLVTWLYVASIIVILGAVVNVVLAEGRTIGYEELPPPQVRGAVPDRQLQQPSVREFERMAERERPSREREESEPRGAPDVTELDARVSELRADLDAFETEVEARTVDRPELEAELKRYVRERLRRGHARGWGPYLVLLYGTVLALGAFYLLDGGWAILAMLVAGLSTLGLYVLFVLFGVGLNALGLPGKALDFVRERR